MEVQAVTSMIIVTLPFPPLPVVCVKSSDSIDSHASSHDLLSVAIASNLVGNNNTAAFDSMKVFEGKKKILMDLNDRIVGIWTNREKDEDNTALEKCYKIFCTQFRLYMEFYPGSSDIRIMDMNSVCASDTIVKQAVEHLNAMASTFVDEERSEEKFQVPLESTNCYKSLIRFYVLGIVELARENTTTAENNRIEL